MPDIAPSPEIFARDQFARLLNDRGLVSGRAVEIGCHRADFAYQFLNNWAGPLLISVDPYCQYAEMPEPREPDYQFALHRMAIHRRASAWRLIKEPSDHAPYHRDIIGHPLDFVYIDGAHDYEHVMQDIAIWWPLVGDTGILAGHDYDDGHPGVVQAVNEFADRTGAVVRLTAGDANPSWYAYKTEPAYLLHFKHYLRGFHLPPVAPPEPKWLLTICIPTMQRRRDRFNRLVNRLAEQTVAAGMVGRVEVLTDDSDAPLGDKRNRMLAAAQGAYVCFFDDDDLPGPHYIEAIAEAIRKHNGVDAITFDGLRYVDGTPQASMSWRLEHGDGSRDTLLREVSHESILDGALYPVREHRRIGCNHICPIRRDIAQRSRFWGSLAYANDQPYWKALHAFGLVQSEHHIALPLYHYLWSQADTGTQQADCHARTRELLDPDRSLIFHRVEQTVGQLPAGTLVWYRWIVDGQKRLVRVEAPDGSGHTVPLAHLSEAKHVPIRTLGG